MDRLWVFPDSVGDYSIFKTPCEQLGPSPCRSINITKRPLLIVKLEEYRKNSNIDFGNQAVMTLSEAREPANGNGSWTSCVVDATNHVGESYQMDASSKQTHRIGR